MVQVCRVTSNSTVPYFSSPVGKGPRHTSNAKLPCGPLTYSWLLFLTAALSVHAQPNANALTVVSAASYGKTVAPASIVTALGAGLSTQTGQGQPDSSGNFPIQLAGTTVLVNGTPAQLLYVSPTQINLRLPAEVPTGVAVVTVNAGSSGTSTQGSANVQAVAPGIFVLDAAGTGAVLNAVTFTPAPFDLQTGANGGCDKRTRLAIFGTGMYLAAADATQVTLHDSAGNDWPLGVEYVGPTQTPGLDQINVVLPTDLTASGTAQLTVGVGGAVSNQVSVVLAPSDLSLDSPACLADFTVSRLSLNSGTQIRGTVTLSSPAPVGGAVVALTSSLPAIQVPSTVTVAAGQASAAFTVNATAVAGPLSANVSSNLGDVTKIIGLVLNPPCLISLNLSADAVVEGNIVTGTLQLNGAAPAGGLVVNLDSSTPLVQVASQVSVPGEETVTVPAGQTSVSFPITATAAAAGITAEISATVGACGAVSAPVSVGPGVCVAGVSPASSTVAGGNGLMVTVALTAPAPLGGVLVNLEASSPVLEVGAAVVIPAGQISASVTLGSAPVTSSTPVTVAANLNGCPATSSAPVTVMPTSTSVCVASLVLSSSVVIGGIGLTGTVTLTSAAPAGGLTVNLQSSNSQVQVPASVTVPAGQISATFNITTSSVSNSVTVTITASVGGCTGAGGSAQMTVNPAGSAVCVSSVALSSNSVIGGTGLTGTVNLTAAAPAGGLTVSLQSSNSQVQAPASVTVPAGQISATFNITTSSVSNSVTVTITASVGGCAGAGGSAQMTVNPPLGVASLSISPSTVTGGNGATGTVTLSGSAPVGGVTVTLQSNNSVAQVGASVTVPGGQMSATFPVTTNPPSTTTQATITGSLGNSSASATLTVNAPLGVASLSISPSTVTGGNGATGTVTLSGPAPGGGVTVTLQSNNPVAQVGANVTVPGGQMSATFPVTTTPPSTTIQATITGSLGNSSASATLTVNPPTVAVCASGLSLSTNAVIGGNGLTGTVFLTAPAPVGGLVVNLAANTPLVQVAATVTVPAGQLSATFNVATNVVSNLLSAAISASVGGCGEVSVNLTVNPLAAAVCVSGLSLSANAVIGGNGVTGTVTLTGPAPAGGLVVNLAANTPLVQVAATVTVPAGQVSATFNVATNVVSSLLSAAISASVGGCAGASVNLTVNPLVVSLSGLTLSVGSVVGGQGLTATVTLSGPAPAGGATCLLSTSNLLVSVPSSVIVPAGQTSAAFAIATNPLLSLLDIVVSVSASYGGSTQIVPLTLMP
jgi:uncharacterized protein (TIGR03437 family)